jgi:D-hydroxyproline dehydrogenase subunit alpha
MRTSAPGVLAAGDGTGVEGVHVAVDEGRLAALGAAVDLDAMSEDAARAAAAPLRARLARRRAFRAALTRMHRVGAGIYRLSTPTTTVCRCEEVTRERLDEAVRSAGDVGVVKGLTRAGMGLCQGRNCQRQIAALIADHHHKPIGEIPMATSRFPARPVPLAALADERVEDAGYFH